MIKEHAISIQGKSHDKSGTCCQDAYSILTLDNGYKVIAVADGVGMCKYADIGARIAVETVVQFIKENFPLDNKSISIKSMLRTGFNRALIEISKEAIRNNQSIDDYETTLMVVIYDGFRGYYAHVGDGGIVGLSSTGTYMELSKKQNFEGEVVPLRAGYEYWQIEEINEDLSAVMVATDGMMDKFRNTNTEQGFYIPLLMIFADPYCIEYQRRKGIDLCEIVKAEQDEPHIFWLKVIYNTLTKKYKFSQREVEKILEDVLDRNLPFYLLASIQDDKTFVCLYNDKNFPESRELSYYSEPDWRQTSMSIERKLYPSLFVGRETEQNQSVNTSTESSYIKEDEVLLGKRIGELIDNTLKDMRWFWGRIKR